MMKLRGKSLIIPEIELYDGASYDEAEGKEPDSPGNLRFRESPGAKLRFLRDLSPGKDRLSKIPGRIRGKTKIVCNKIPPKSVAFHK